MTDTSARSFDAAFGAVAHVEGWMTEDQAKLLWQEASRCTAGDQIVEIGSFRGRSAVILARAAPGGVAVVAIDPHLGTDRGPQEITTTAQLGQSEATDIVVKLLVPITTVAWYGYKYYKGLP